MRISDWSSDVCSSDLLISPRLFLGWRLHNMLSIIAFIGGAGIGGFAVGSRRDPRSPQGSRRAQRRPDRAVNVDTAASQIASLRPKVSADTKRLATRDHLDAAGDKFEAIFPGLVF